MATRTFVKRAVAAFALCAMVALFMPRMLTTARAAATDLDAYKAMAKETLQLVTAGKMKEASAKGREIEEQWDGKDMGSKYPDIDAQMDTMNSALGSGNAKKATDEINKFMKMLDDASK